MRSSQASVPHHIPVMVQEVLSSLNIQPNGIYVDGTIGFGGHSKHILSHLSPKGQLIGIDRDGHALEICKSNLQSCPSPKYFYQSSYHKLTNILQEFRIPGVNGILLDLGISSFQLNSPNRGFSYSTNGPLDMRFDLSSSKTVSKMILESSEEELAFIIRTFGEERYAKNIAKKIKQAKLLQTTMDLAEVIRKCTPPAHRNRSYARVFQALRIAVNQELDRLKNFLENCLDFLLLEGRLVIISYHSLEDRLVKHTFKDLQKEKRFSILTKKPIIPSEIECNENSRAKSAKLRSGERIL